jgi:deoxyribonuclease IV
MELKYEIENDSYTEENVALFISGRVVEGLSDRFSGMLRRMRESINLPEAGEVLGNVIRGGGVVTLISFTEIDLSDIYPEMISSPVDKFYLIFPLHAKVLLTDINQWKRATFSIGDRIRTTYSIGRHVKKLPSLFDTVKSLDKKPYQLYLSSQLKLNISVSELTRVRDLVESKGLSIYSHCPHMINLSNPDAYIVESLKLQLETSRAAGFKGVVVHVGKPAGRGGGMETMFKNITESLQYSSRECPLLLETPAGQGTELCKGLEDFINFSGSIESDRFGLCLDTCHVFASGHSPYEYLHSLLNRLGSRLKLIHFNDSKRERGCCVDRHACIGEGHIGEEELNAVALLAHSNSIPMLVEEKI